MGERSGKLYLPLYADTFEETQDLTDEEFGRLIRAVGNYMRGKEWESIITGNERYAFRFMKGQVDRNTEISKARAKAASSKKEETEATDSKSEANVANSSKQEQMETNENKTEQNETNSPKEKEKEEEKNKEKENKKEEQKAKAEVAERFVRFYSEYPRHEAKQDAMKAFESLKPDEELLQKMLIAVRKQKRSEQWTKDNGQFIPLPASWIRGKRWEDEITQPAQQIVKPVRGQEYEQRNYVGSQDEARKRMLAMLAGETA